MLREDFALICYAVLLTLQMPDSPLLSDFKNDLWRIQFPCKSLSSTDLLPNEPELREKCLQQELIQPHLHIPIVCSLRTASIASTDANLTALTSYCYSVV
jgi:hypothetical protein